MSVAEIIEQNTEISEEWQFAIRHAVAQQELEGGQVSPEAQADLERVARGEITFEDYTRNTIIRHTNGIR